MAQIEIPKPNNQNGGSLIRGPRSSLNPENSPKDEKPALKGGISKAEPTFKEKLKRSFVKEDLHDVGDYILFDVIIPSIRKSIFDTIVGTASQIFGVSVPRSSVPFDSGRYNGSPQTEHERRYRDYTSLQRRTAPTNQQAFRYDRFYAADYPFEFKEDADFVLEQMMDICDSRGWVSVAKFFEIADPQGTIAGRNPYTNNDYGWHNITGTQVRYVQDRGYVLTLPPARSRLG